MEPVKSEMISSQMCFSCHFWNRLLKMRIESAGSTIRNFVIEGLHYQIDTAKPEGRGMAGRKFVIIDDTGQRYVTHNLWHQGTVPDVWRDEFPDNAKFETGGYSKIGDGGAWDASK